MPKITVYNSLMSHFEKIKDSSDLKLHLEEKEATLTPQEFTDYLAMCSNGENALNIICRIKPSRGMLKVLLSYAKHAFNQTQDEKGFEKFLNHKNNATFVPFTSLLLNDSLDISTKAEIVTIFLDCLVETPTSLQAVLMTPATRLNCLPLYTAVLKEQRALVEILLEYGDVAFKNNPNAKKKFLISRESNFGNTTFHLAVQKNNNPILELLFKFTKKCFKEDPVVWQEVFLLQDNKGIPLINLAVDKSKILTFKIILIHGKEAFQGNLQGWLAFLNRRISGWALLSWLVKSKNLEGLETLLEEVETFANNSSYLLNFLISTSDKDHNAPIFYSVFNGMTDVTLLILSKTKKFLEKQPKLWQAVLMSTTDDGEGSSLLPYAAYQNDKIAKAVLMDGKEAFRKNRDAWKTFLTQTNSVGYSPLDNFCRYNPFLLEEYLSHLQQAFVQGEEEAYQNFLNKSLSKNREKNTFPPRSMKALEKAKEAVLALPEDPVSDIFIQDIFIQDDAPNSSLVGRLPGDPFQKSPNQVIVIDNLSFPDHSPRKDFKDFNDVLSGAENFFSKKTLRTEFEDEWPEVSIPLSPFRSPSWSEEKPAQEKKPKQVSKVRPNVSTKIHTQFTDLSTTLHGEISRKGCHFLFMMITTGDARYQSIDAIVTMLATAVGKNNSGTLVLGMNRRANEKSALEKVTHEIRTALGKNPPLHVIVIEFMWEVTHQQNVEVDVAFGQMRNKVFEEAIRHIDLTQFLELIFVSLDADIKVYPKSLQEIQKTTLDAGSLGSIYEHPTPGIAASLAQAASRMDMGIKGVLGKYGYMLEHCLFLKKKALAAVLEALKTSKPNMFPFDNYAAESRGLFRYLEACGINYGFVAAGEGTPKNVGIAKGKEINIEENTKFPWGKFKKAIFGLPYSSARRESFAKQFAYVLGCWNKGHLINKIANLVYLPKLLHEGFSSRDTALERVDKIFKVLRLQENENFTVKYPEFNKVDVLAFKAIYLAPFEEKEEKVLTICKQWANALIHGFFWMINNDHSALDKQTRLYIQKLIKKIPSVLPSPFKIKTEDMTPDAYQKFYNKDLYYLYEHRPPAGEEIKFGVGIGMQPNLTLNGKRPAIGPHQEQLAIANPVNGNSVNDDSEEDDSVAENSERLDLEARVSTRKAHTRRLGVTEISRLKFRVMQVNTAVLKEGQEKIDSIPKELASKLKFRIPEDETAMILFSYTTKYFALWKKGDFIRNINNSVYLYKLKETHRQNFEKTEKSLAAEHPAEIVDIELQDEPLEDLKEQVLDLLCTKVPVKASEIHWFGQKNKKVHTENSPLGGNKPY